MKRLNVDLCVIGGGSGGLSVAAASSQMGLGVALIEKDKMGGDCLNYGCVPSKAVLAAGKLARSMRHAAPFGIANHEPQVDYAKVRDHIQDVIATIAPHDSVERFEGLGVTVLKGAAAFINKREVIVGDTQVRAKRFVIATGSSAATPPISGLDKTPYLTNETVFDLAEQPQHLIVIGGGPIGCELAQAHAMLGTKVTVLEMFTIMPKDDPALVAVVRQALIADGVTLHEQVQVKQTAASEQGVVVTIEQQDGQTIEIQGSHLLVAAGRKPNLDGLKLEQANIAYTPKGIQVDARLRTTNKRIFAIGDVAGSYQFTHAAGYHAGIVIRNALFHLPAKVSYRALPWVTYTHPELSHVGISEQQAKEQQIKHRVLTMPFSDIDRAVAEREAAGCIKAIVSPKGIVLGASIVGAEAGDLIVPWVLAVNNQLKISALASMIVPYPTCSDISKRVAGSYYTPSLYSKRMKKIVRLLSHL